MPEIFSKAWNRRTIIIIIVLTLLVFYVLAYGLVPMEDPQSKIPTWQIIGGILKDVAATLFATSFLGGCIIALTPTVMERAKIEPVDPNAIRGYLERAALQSSIWQFKGGLGRDFRISTLPLLDRESRKKSAAKHIIVILIDPTNDKACESYARYRTGTDKTSNLTANKVTRELFATILTIAQYGSNNPLLDIRIGLTETWSSFRIDLASTYAIVTRADAQDAGLRCDAGSSFYDAYQAELQASLAQSRQIAIPSDQQYDKSTSAAALLFNALGFDHQFSSNELDEIIALANVTKSPYDR